MKKKKISLCFREVTGIVLTFLATLLAWIFFRSETLGQAFSILNKIFSHTIWAIPSVLPINLLMLIVSFVAIEWMQRTRSHGLDLEGIRLPKSFRWSFYLVCITIIFIFNGDPQQFIVSTRYEPSPRNFKKIHIFVF